MQRLRQSIHLHSASCTGTARARRGDPPPSHAEILGRDRERVASIHRKAGRAAASKGSNATLRARWGKPLGTSNYFISVGLGTPARDLCVEFDTGSDQSWVQCKPCGDCYEQHDPLFDPEGSSTYAAVSCGARECREFGSRNCSSSSDGQCRYEVSYGDQSRTVGDLARDTLALTPTAAVPGFMFGCGHRDAGVFGEVDGLVDLGRGKASLASQAAARYGAVFSYCLPSSPSTVGYLTFGGAAASASANAQFTALVAGQHDDASFYYLNLTGISLGTTALSISPNAFSLNADGSGGLIIDSGTTITSLANAAYQQVRAAVKSLVTLPAIDGSDSTGLGLCFALSSPTSAPPAMPSMTLHFDGADMVLPVDSYMLLDSGLWCLAMQNTSNGAMSTLGNYQQQDMHILYDVGQETLSFAPTKCSTL